MPSLSFKQVDVFTATPFLGNPVAVVIGAEGLATEAMQRIANWTNLSETTFLLAPSAAGADYRLRIFTPRMELPFAGHPTLGSAHAALESGFARPRDGRLRQECGAGLIDITLAGERLYLRAPQPRISTLKDGALGDALGARLAGGPVRVDVGVAWLVAECETDVGGLQPDLAAVAALSAKHDAVGVTVFSTSGDGEAAIHVRSFAPAHGIVEDPVCGSGNVSVAAYLRAANLLGRFGGRYTARQGMQVGRDGRVAVRVTAEAIEIGGACVTCVDGTLRTA
jgi:PhzF family phenazine biosynthesis protein